MNHPRTIMKKICSAAALTILTGLLISGCAGSPAPSASVSDMAVPNTPASSNALPSTDGKQLPAPATESKAPITAPSAVPSASGAKVTALMPAPDSAQYTSLLTELKKIDPALDSPRITEDARRTCRMILRGAPEVAQISYAKRLLMGTKIEPGAASDEAAKKIIEIIKSNGFCNTAP